MLLFLTDIPLQNRLSQQISQHWRPFQDLKQTFAVSRRAEQLRLRTQQRIIATSEDSVLRTEMTGLESQEVNAPKRVLFFKSMRWLGQLRIIFQTQTLGGSSYVLTLYINSVKEVVSHVEVELYKPRRYISLATDSGRDWVWTQFDNQWTCVHV